MRGQDEQTSHMFSYVSPEQRVPADHPLRAMRALTDEALRSMSRRFAGLYATTGRPSIPPEQLLRGHCQVADERAFFSLGAERPSLGQQAHVTSSH